MVLEDQQYMQRCLDLAELGKGMTAPNPMVGAVVVHAGRIIGEGYHHQSGHPHAEVEAIRSVENQELLKESTLYINLEPCNHFGKTPPCTQLILEKNIPKVVVGQKDPNPLVSGRGLSKLKERGVEVIEHCLEKEAEALNKRFNTYHRCNRPYVILKWAQSQDGFIDRDRTLAESNQATWITDDYCRMLVHKWRAEESAILVGTQTALLDNPQLNIRGWTGRNPLRCVIDRKSQLPEHLHLFDGSQPTLVFSMQAGKEKPNLSICQLSDSTNSVKEMLNHLFKNQILSIIVEGGAQVLQSFIDQNLWDEARIFTGPICFEMGVAAPKLAMTPCEQLETGNSHLHVIYHPNNRYESDKINPK